MSAFKSKTAWGIVLILALIGAVAIGVFTGKVAWAGVAQHTHHLGDDGKCRVPSFHCQDFRLKR